MAQFADHSILQLIVQDLLLKNLNVGQTGRLKMFPNGDNYTFNWSCTYRTMDVLELLRKTIPELNKLGNELVDIVRREELSVQERNVLLREKSEKLIPEIVKLGFNVKSFLMEPYSLFNPGVVSSTMLVNPDDYLQGPNYFIEDTKSYEDRLLRAFGHLMVDSPDIISCQEIEYGLLNGINLSQAHTELAKLYPNYDSTAPRLKPEEYSCMTVTYYNKDTIEDVSTDHTEPLASLREKTKICVRDPVKLHAHAFKHLKTNKVYYVLNYHGDYGKLNTEEPWAIFRELLQTTEGLIVTGDFNVQIKNRHLIDNALEGLDVKSVILETPESKDFNPTCDAIIVRN